MAYKMTKAGSLDNEITYEFMCDAVEDMNAIGDEYRTLGSIAIVLAGESGGLEIYITNSAREWIPLNTSNDEIDLSGYATKEELTAALSNLASIQTEIVQELPQSDISESTIYFVPKEGANGDSYDEYMYIGSAWEKVGNTQVDLSNYATLSDIPDTSIYAPKANPEFTGSISMGRKTNTTIGISSIATGSQTTASNQYSHAEGRETIASGQQSHAEGYKTTASGTSSHAEGDSTIASGYSAHAEGAYTLADGDYVHASGQYNKSTRYPTWVAGTTYAIGNKVTYSGMGFSCKTANSDESFNQSHWNTLPYNSDILFVVGMGTADNNRHNAFVITRDGGIQEGYDTIASGYQAHSEGIGTIASGDQSHAEGNYTTASNAGAHAEGIGVKAANVTAHAEGYRGLTNLTRTINGTVYNIEAHSMSDHIEGYETLTYGGQPGAHAEGYRTAAIGNASHSEGANTVASGNISHAEGNTTTASGDYSHSEGYNTKAVGANSHVEGYGDLSATKTISNVTYTGSGAYGYNSHAEGNNTWAIGNCSHAEGDGTVATASYTHAEGQGTQATNAYAHAEGGGTLASGSASHAEGGSTQATGQNAHAEGATTQATASCAHAEGMGSIASGSSAHAEGNLTTASGTSAHTEGSSTTANGNMAHAEGMATNAYGNFSHAEGSGNGNATQIINNATYTGSGAYGITSHTEGTETWAFGQNAHAEGWCTIATGSNSHVGGKYNIVDSYIDWPAWEANTSYAIGDKVKRIISSVTTGYKCITANSDSTFTASKWIVDNEMNYVEIIGNGTSDTNGQSNARALDWDGNEHLMGDIYVGCNADSTGGTKLPRIPEAPSTDGTYILQATVTSGIPTYSWVSLSSLSGVTF